MGIFASIRKKEKIENKVESYFKTLNAYSPTFTSFEGSIYEMELTRAAIHSFATHCSKLKFFAEGVRNTAGKHTENEELASATDTMVSVTLGGFEFMKVISISKSAKAMSVSAFEKWIVDMLAGDITRAIDNYIINDATNGIAALTFDTTNQVSVKAAYTYNDIMNLISLLPAAYDSEAKFLINKKTLWNDIRGIVDSNKRPIFDPESKTLCGYPVIEDDNVATANKGVYLGRWLDVVGNLSEDITVESNANSGFTRGAIDYRGFAVFDSKPAKSDGIVRLITTA